MQPRHRNNNKLLNLFMQKTMTQIKLDTTEYSRQLDIIEAWASNEYEKATHTDDMLRLTKRLEEAGLGDISDRIVESWLCLFILCWRRCNV